MSVTVLTPAKINLTLDIVGTRADGYHLLESLFQSVGIYDTVTARKRWRKGIVLQADECNCPAEKNTAYKPIEVTAENDFLIWGVVTYTIKKM